MTTPTAFYRSYQHRPSNRATPRLHLRHATMANCSWCRVTTKDGNGSRAVHVPLPTAALGDYQWCPTCLGRQAEHLGLLDQVAALLGAAHGGDHG